MTNSKSVDNYRFMTAEPFVINNRTHCLIDGVQFVIYTIAPDLLPFSQTVVVIQSLLWLDIFTTIRVLVRRRIAIGM